MKNLIIIDDEHTICQSLQFAFEDTFNVYTFTNPIKALPLFKELEIALVLLDLKLDTYSGLDILEEIKHLSPHSLVIIMTAYGSIPSSIEAMKKGAYYYVTKPLQIEELELIVEKAFEVYNLKYTVRRLSNELGKLSEGQGLLGQSPPLLKIKEMIDKIKDIDSNILITGESGTGKEVCAREIHSISKRKAEKFVAINCAAIPENLLESELFGYKKGAFTGAHTDKDGLFKVASGGTLFLDEIGEVSLSFQSKLLRVIQEKRITPLGGTEEIEIDVRLIAATNRNLLKEVKANRFREDLYYRLNVIPIHIPPLKERKEDVPILAAHFIQKISQKMGKPIEGIAEEALQHLKAYSFPGNVRELENIIERAIALTSSVTLQKKDLALDNQVSSNGMTKHQLIPVYVGETLADIEKRVILHNLAHFNGNRRKTASDRAWGTNYTR